MKLTPAALTESAFHAFGTFYEMTAEGTGEGLVRSVGESYSDAYTKAALLDRHASLGRTVGAALPRTVESMERHQHTQEAMLSITEAVAFLVARESGNAPKAEDVKAFILRPSQIVVLKRGVWHSPAFGILRKAAYYWMAETYDNEPTVWRAIEGGPVELLRPAEGA